MKNNLFNHMIVGTIAVLLFLIPTAVRVFVIDSDTFIAGLYAGGQLLDKVFGQVDAFALIKSYLLYLFVIVLIILFTTAIIKNYIIMDFDYIISLGLIFIFYLTVSSYMSDYPVVAFFGIRDRYEGLFAFMAYIVLMVITRYSVKNNRHINYLITAIFVGGVVIAVISILQFFGLNIFKAPLIASLVIANELPGSGTTSSLFTKISGGSAFGTLYNPNYLSGYLSMIIFIPMVVYLFIKTGKYKYIGLLLTVICWMGLLSSKSSSGFVTVVFGMITVFLIKIMVDKRSWKQILVLLLCFSFAFMAMDIISEGGMGNEYTSVFRYIGQLAKVDYDDVDNSSQLISIDELVDMKYLDESGREKWQQLLSYYPYESSTDRLGSGRGFIWRYTVDLIMEKPIFGHGLDTIMHTFPHGSMRKLYSFGKMNVIVDKPHSIYLQLAYGSGVPALIIFLALNIIVIIKAITFLYTNTHNTEHNILLNNISDNVNLKVLLLLIIIAAYLIQGIFNDSTVGVSVVYWVSLGMLIGILSPNYNIANECEVCEGAYKLR